MDVQYEFNRAQIDGLTGPQRFSISSSMDIFNNENNGPQPMETMTNGTGSHQAERLAQDQSPQFCQQIFEKTC